MSDELPSLGKVLAWTFAAVIGLTLFFGTLGVVTGVVSLPFRVAGQASRIIDRTIDADNVIANYEWFKRQCQDIKAQDTIIADAAHALSQFEQSAGPRTGWDFQDKQEHNRLSANVTGAKQYQASMVGDYNARARMMNRSIFNTEPCDAQVPR
jgi:hypothetical protein